MIALSFSHFSSRFESSIRERTFCDMIMISYLYLYHYKNRNIHRFLLFGTGTNMQEEIIKILSQDNVLMELFSHEI